MERIGLKQDTLQLSVNRIIPCSFIDGPGCRMAIFLQGCNMNCLYCHNPETQRFCSNCGLCRVACPEQALALRNGAITHLPEKCRNCDACLAACQNFSTPKSRKFSVSELFTKIKRAAPLLSGITLSGGECTLQTAALLELFTLLHKETDLTAFVDTNGLVSDADFEALLAAADAFCFDLKAWDDKKHLALTGCSNVLVKQNLAAAAEAAKLYEVRTVLVEGYSDSPQDIAALGVWLAALPGTFSWRLIPFRPQGVKGSLRDKPPFPNERHLILHELARSILGTRVIEA